MLSRVIELHGVRWVLGLEWRRAESGQDALQKGRADARQFGARYFAVRGWRRGRGNDAGYPQYGLLDRANRTVKAGDQAAAAAVADAIIAESSHRTDLLGAFEIPGGGIWLLVIRDDVVIEGGDVYYDDPAEAEARYRELYDRFAASREAQINFYAPATWNIKRAGEPDLWAQLGGAIGPDMLPASRLELYQYPIAVAVAAVAVLLGLYFYNDHLEAEEKRIRLARAPQNQQQPAATVIPRPWNSEPLASAFLADCLARLNDTYRPMIGWDVEDMVCTSTETKIVYQGARGRGSVSMLLPLLDVGRYDITTDAARVAWTVPGLARAVPRPSQTELAALKTWRDQLVIAAQIGGATLTMPNPANPQSGAVTGTEFEIRTSFYPREWGGVLDQLPGLVIGSLATSPGQSAGLTWIIRGVVYDHRYYAAIAKK